MSTILKVSSEETNSRVSFSTQVQNSLFCSTTKNTTVIKATVKHVEKIIVPTPPTPFNKDMNNTVLAWLQQELAVYVDLMLMTTLRDLSTKDYWLGRPLICLAHRFFPDAVPNLREQLEHHVTSHLRAIELFKERLGVLLNDNLDIYFGQIQTALEQHDVTLDTSMVEQQAIHILVPLNRLFHQLVEIVRQESISHLSSPTPQRSPSPPRIQEDTISLEDIEVSLKQLEAQDLKVFQASVSELPALPFALARRISVVDATHAALILQLQQGNMRTGIEFSTATAYIRNELEFIQAKMLKTTTTDVGIQDLEARSTKVGKLIDTMRERFKEHLEQDDQQQQDQFRSLYEKYRLIMSWVDEVRVWFVEAERIRGWIETRIEQLESKPLKHPLDDIEYEYTLDQIAAWNAEHDELDREVQAFDAQDMTRLRAHVKTLTSAGDQAKDLSPADTTTIEITFTTLMTLDRLMHLLRRHAYDLHMLTLRMAWEQAHDQAVAWVRRTTDEVRQFVQQKARWRPPPLVVVSLPPDTDTKNDMINTLIEFEKQCAAFDQGQFTTTVNAYQDLDDACHVELPSHLESRQVAIEEAFEELTHRVGFARQVVEQFLVVTDFLEKADQLKSEGEQLRQKISHVEEQELLEQHDKMNEIMSTSEFSEKVALFQENAVRLVTGVAARVPYPEATHPTDQQANDDANEVIRMVMGARKSALVLFGEALDQSLASLRRAIQLQKRAKQIQDEVTRLTGWVDERLKAMEKSKIDVFVAGKCALDDTDVARLKKEREGQVAKLNGIRENDVKRLEENLFGFQQSSSAHYPNNTHVASQITHLHDAVSYLDSQLNHLEETLKVHGTRLDILGQRISWESQHTKSTVWVSNTIFEVWDFISRKAQWRASTTLDDFEEDQVMVDQEFKALHSKILAYHETQFTLVQQKFEELVSGFESLASKSMPPEHLQRRQDTLNQNFHNLQDLLVYAQQVLDQHIALTQFTDQVKVLSTQGLSLVNDIQQALARVNEPTIDDVQQQLVQSVQLFDQDVVQLWMQSGSQLPYPQCPEDARSTRPTTNDDEVSTEVATAVYRTYTELQDLVKQMNELLQRLSTGIQHRIQLKEQYHQVEIVIETMLTIMQSITMYSFDLTVHTVTLDHQPVELDACKQAHAEFVKQIQQLQTNDYEPLLNQWEETQAALVSDQCDAIVSVKANQALMVNLSTTWESLNHHIQQWAQQLQVCNHRKAWYDVWKHQWQVLNQLQENVREWMNEKHLWLSNEDHRQDLQTLVDRLEEYSATLDQHMQEELPAVTSAHDKLKHSYQALSTSSFESDAVVGALEQSDLDKLVSKLLDLISTQRSDILMIQQRHDWETSADQVLGECLAKEKAIEQFIKTCARWSPSQEPSCLSQEGLAVMDQATTEQVNAIRNLLHASEQLKQSTEPVTRRISGLETAQERIQQHHAFMNEVVAQHHLIHTCLDKVNEIEQLAELTRTRFLSLAPADDLAENEDLESYKQRVHEVHIHIQTAMKYPVRQFLDHDAQAKDEDMTHNASVAEMISARQSRLVELGHTLSSILKSKERLSRRQAAEASYKAEAEVVREWIAAKQQALDEQHKPSQDTESLRSAVSAINGLSSAITAYATSVHGLGEAATKYVSVIQQQLQADEDDTEQVKASVELIQFMQSEINTAWKTLTDNAAKKQHEFSKDLRYVEFIHLADNFKASCEQLTTTITSMSLEEMSEDVVNQWQKEIQTLDNKSLEAIKSRVREEVVLLGQQDPSTSIMQACLDECVQQYDAARVLAQERFTEANHHRLKAEYVIGADTLSNLLTETEISLAELVTNPPVVIRGLDLVQDKAFLDQLTERYNRLCQTFDNELHEKYDEQRSLYRFLQLNKVSDLEAIDQRHTDLERHWKQIKTDLTQDKHQWVGQIAQWYDLHQKLNEMQHDSLAGIIGRLEQMDIATICLDEQETATLPIFLEQDAALLNLLKHRMTACWDVAQDLSDTDQNLTCFRECYDALDQQIKDTEARLNDTKHAAQQQVDWLNCQQGVKSFALSVEQEIESLEDGMDILASHVVDDMDTKALEVMYRQAVTNYAVSESKQKDLSQQFAVLNARIEALENMSVPELKTELEEALADVEDTAADMCIVNDMIRRVVGLGKSSDNIQSWLMNCSQAIDHLSQLSPQEEGESVIALELATLSQKMTDFEKVMQSFRDIEQELLAIKEDNDKNEMQKVVSALKERVILPITDKVEAQWKATQDALKEVEVQVEKTTRGVAIARKMKHLMALVGETREFVHSIQLFDYDLSSTIGMPIMDDQDMIEESSIIVHEEIQENKLEDLSVGEQGESVSNDQDLSFYAEQDEKKDTSRIPPIMSMPRQRDIEIIQVNLKALESEMKPQIKQELKELNAIMASHDMDLTFKQQHKQVKESVQSLMDLLNKTHVTLKKSLSIGKYLAMVDDLEILQSSLEEAVSQSAPHHTLIASSTTFSRTDLQAKLIELDARFKYYERKIVRSMGTAKDQIREVTRLSPKGGVHVNEHFKQMEHKWERIKKQFKTRKIELSRTIDTAADSNKDQQSRIRKSSLPTRKASSLLRERADVSLLRQQHQRLSPTMSSTSSTSSSTRTTSSSRISLVPQGANRSRYLAPPTIQQHQPSKSATSLKSRTSSQPQQPKPPLNSYVADPDNDLDMEIGRIVNETPYRVKVKMVPGEVGRYWFGDANPKLAYCRVLKSKMVMVRVGGGWTELSQFLRDHALLEGDFIPRQNRVLSNINAVTKGNRNMIPEEDEEPKSPTIQEGFIETHRAQPLRHHRSVSPNTLQQQQQQQPVTGSPSHSASTTTSHHTPGYKDGDKFIAVDQHGNQLEVKMRRAAMNFMNASSSSSTNNSTTTANNSSTSSSNMNDYTKRRMARRKKKLATNTSLSNDKQDDILNTAENTPK